MSVPGRALAGVIKLLPASSLPPEGHQLLAGYHADVVQLLTSEGARSILCTAVGRGAAAEPEHTLGLRNREPTCTLCLLVRAAG